MAEQDANDHLWRMVTEYLCTMSHIDTAIIGALAEYSNFLEEAEKPALERLALRYLEDAIATDPSFPIRPLLNSNPLSMSCEDVFLACLERKFNRRYPPLDEMETRRNFVPAFIAERKRALPPPSLYLVPLPLPENSPIASPNPQNLEQLQVASTNPQISSPNPRNLEQISGPNPENLQQAQIPGPNPENIIEQVEISSPNPENVVEQVEISSPNPETVVEQVEILSPNPENVVEQVEISSPNPGNLQQAQIPGPNLEIVVEQVEIWSPNPENVVEQVEVWSRNVEEESDVVVLERRGKEIAIEVEKQLDKCKGSENGVQDGNTNTRRYPKRQRKGANVGTSKGKEIPQKTRRYPKRHRRPANIYLGQQHGSTTPSKTLGGRRKLFFSKEEEEKLTEGVRFYGKSWKEILQFGKLVFDKTRHHGDLKDKWRNMSKKQNKNSYS